MNISPLTGERKTANASREKLWELLSPVRLSGGSEPCSWQLSYHHFLQEEGVDTETQNRALLLKLWVTQVRVAALSHSLLHTGQTMTEKHATCPHPEHTLEFHAMLRSNAAETHWIPHCNMPQPVHGCFMMTSGSG